MTMQQYTKEGQLKMDMGLEEDSKYGGIRSHDAETHTTLEDIVHELRIIKGTLAYLANIGVEE